MLDEHARPDVVRRIRRYDGGSGAKCPRQTTGATVRLISMLLAVPALWPVASAAASPDFPKLKSGLWETTTSAPRAQGKAAQVSTLCLDDSVQQEMYRMSTGMLAGMCSKFDVRTAGNKVTSEAVCDLGGSRMQSKAVMTLIGNTAYRTEARATFDPPFMGNKETATVIEGRHVGPCKPGQKPGDLMLPDGKTVNIRQLSGAKG